MPLPRFLALLALVLLAAGATIAIASIAAPHLPGAILPVVAILVGLGAVALRMTRK